MESDRQGHDDAVDHAAVRPDDRRRYTLVVGVTGGIGSGKTTVCKMLEELGAAVFYADDEAKRIMIDDPEVVRSIVSAFGPRSYHPDGSLDRRYLAEHVFASKENVARINAIVHPKVFEAFAAFRREAENDGVRLVVKEAALLFEAGATADLDAVVVVDAPERKRVDRVVLRDKRAPGDVISRIRHQIDPARSITRADHVIVNDGSLEDLRREVGRLFESLVTEKQDGGG